MSGIPFIGKMPLKLKSFRFIQADIRFHFSDRLQDGNDITEGGIMLVSQTYRSPLGGVRPMNGVPSINKEVVLLKQMHEIQFGNLFN